MHVDYNSSPNLEENCDKFFFNIVKKIIYDIDLRWRSVVFMEIANEKDETNSDNVPITDKDKLVSVALAIRSMLGYAVGREDERVEKVLCEYTNFRGVAIRVF